MDNAALAAIIFLERGLSPETDRCVICSTSEQPQLGPLLYTADRKDLASNLANRSAAITAERVRTATSAPCTHIQSWSQLESSSQVFRKLCQQTWISR